MKTRSILRTLGLLAALGATASQAQTNWQPITVSNLVVSNQYPYKPIQNAGIWVNRGFQAPASNTNALLYGHAVSLSGNRLAVGSPGKAGRFEKQGAVYIHQLSTFPRVAMTRVFTPAGGDWQDTAYFGAAVDLDGDLCLVGAPGCARHSVNGDRNLYPGAAYLYEAQSGLPNTWLREAKFTPPQGTPNHARFGQSVAVSEPYAVVGAPGIDRVFVYRKIGWFWLRMTTLHLEGSDLGASVALDGNRLLIGAPFAARGQGVVYAFEINDAQVIFRQVIGGHVRGSEFGNSLALDGDRLVVGAIGENTYSGAAYIYQFLNGTFRLVKRLAPQEPWSYQGFGDSVDISGNQVVVGELGDPWDDPVYGKTYIFRQGLLPTTWSRVMLHESPAPDRNTIYSPYHHDVAIDGNLAVTAEAIDDAYGWPDQNLGRVLFFRCH